MQFTVVLSDGRIGLHDVANFANGNITGTRLEGAFYFDQRLNTVAYAAPRRTYRVAI